MKEKKFLLVAPLFTAILLVFLNFLALNYHLYWRFWWLDIPMHLLGGFTLALVGIWLVSLSGISKNPYNRKNAFLIAIVFGLGLGIIWEITEYSIGFTFNTIGSYPLDTAKDLFMDLFGAVLAFVYADSLLL